MESPFSHHNNSFVLYLEPILNSYYKTYQNVITLNTMPLGPIADMVVPISIQKLSPFQEAGAFSGNLGVRGNCTMVLLRYPKAVCGGANMKNTDSFMTADDIPSVISYLLSNGYTVNTDITKMMFKSRAMIGGISETRFSGDRKLIAMASYSG
jgi:hypothetical protein